MNNKINKNMKTPPWHSIMLIIMALFISSSLYAQGNPKLYVVVQHTDTKVDAMNMERLNKELISKYSANSDVVFINYDVKNDFISADTKADLDWYTVYQAVSENNNQEGITIIDPTTKRVLNNTTLNANTADILKTINNNSEIATIPPGR